MGYEISDQVLEVQFTAVVRGELPVSQLPAWREKAFAIVSGFLAAAGIAPSGPPFARYTHLGDLAAIEAGYPVPRGLIGKDGVEPSLLPGGRAAVAVHLGAYDGLPEVHEAVRGWLAERGRHQAGPHWEIYRTDPRAEPDPARWRTEVVTPYRAEGVTPRREAVGDRDRAAG